MGNYISPYLAQIKISSWFPQSMVNNGPQQQQQQQKRPSGERLALKSQIPPFPGAATAMRLTSASGGLMKPQGPLLPFPGSFGGTAVVNGGRGYGYGGGGAGGVLVQSDNSKRSWF
jgi:hypothetical protein